MSAALWKNAANIFDVAVILDGRDRERYINSSCGNDRDLMAAVRDLLVADSEESATSDGVNAQCIIDLVSKLKQGEVVDAWRIVGELGSGGMGTVYLAERCDSEVEQLVAIKVLQYGVDAHRFRLERQVLANLSHPNIAGFLDGGSLSDGRPYVVMEYVDGIPIDQWCKENNADLSLRLKIFTKLCDAVDHAHRNLVVHRDIKPANVLVDKNGEPKLLDFGIVKNLSQDIRLSRRVNTDANSRLMTRGYASPEQLLGGPITTETDIFSLGVLLHEVIYGSRPNCTSIEGAAEFLNAAKSENSWASGLAEVSENSSQCVETLSAGRKAELSAILTCALRFNAADRYGAATALSNDLQAFIERRPVSATRQSLFYFVRKYVERNRSQAAVLVLLFIISIASALSALVNYSIAITERDLAVVARKSEQLQSEVLLDAFKFANADLVERPVSFSQVLTRAHQRLFDASRQMVLLDAEVYLVLAKALLSHSRLDEARGLLEASIEAIQRSDMKTRHLPQSYEAMAYLELKLRNYGKALAANDMARSYLEYSDDPDASVALALQEAVINSSMGKVERGIEILEGLIEDVREGVAVSRPLERQLFQTLASFYDVTGDNARWGDALRDAAAFAGMLEPNDPSYLDLLIDLARLDSIGLEYEMAMMKLAEAERVIKRFYDLTHPQYGLVVNRMANIHYFRGEYQAALDGYRKAVRVRENLVGHLDRDVIHWVFNAHLPLERMGDLVGAAAAVGEAVRRYRELDYHEGTELAYFLVVHGDLTERLGFLAEAESIYRESIFLSKRKERNFDVLTELAEAQCRLGLNLVNRGRFDEAVYWLEQCMQNVPVDAESEFYLEAGRSLRNLVEEGDV